MTIKKYRLGNQPKEYELSTDYLGWIPQGTNGWYDFLDPLTSPPTEVVIVNPGNGEAIILNLHQQIIKDAFPMSFYAEERAKDWDHFFVVSKKDSISEQFIIPLH